MATVASLLSLLFPLVMERTTHAVGGGLTPAPRHMVPSLASLRTPAFDPSPYLVLATGPTPQPDQCLEWAFPLSQECVMQLLWAYQMVEGHSGPSHMKMGRGGPTGSLESVDPAKPRAT